MHTDTFTPGTEFDPTPVFVVALRECSSLPEPQRQHAEMRYARVLERQLGSAQAVAETLRTIERLEEAPPEEGISEMAKQTYQRWFKAARAAAQSAMQGLQAEEEAYFEVRICQH